LYAMLLTAAGQILPPLKVPKSYRSVEVNRIKRQIRGADEHARFRHAVEAGVRLSLGFEWLLRNDATHTSTSMRTKTADHKCFHVGSVERRITQNHVTLDIASGGDGGWIERAWNVGPNSISKDDDISSLIKCPVWNPEVKRGGICPLSHPSE